MVGEMVALGGGCKRGCAALLELRKRQSKRESALVLFCKERKEIDAGRMCVVVAPCRICIHKQRKVLRILLSARRSSPGLPPAVFLCLFIC